MRVLKYTVPDSYAGIAVKSFLRGYCGLSSRMLIRLKQTENGITLSGHPLRTIDRLNAGDELILTLPEEEPETLPVSLEVPVLYEDDDVIVFDKPAGMAVHPCPGCPDRALSNAARFGQLQKGESWRFRPVYRLDQDTSGLVLVAKHAHAAALLGGAIRKTYLALCEGILSQSGSICRPIRLKPGHSVERETAEEGLSAVTHYTPLAFGREHTLLAIRLETGRTHQIRVHLSSVGHPLAGDGLYGGSRNLMVRQALHCGLAEFIHPLSGAPVHLLSPLPEDFCTLLKKTGIDPEPFRKKILFPEEKEF